MPAPAPTPATALRPRSGSELIDAAFVLFRRNYTEFVTAMAAFLVPPIVLRLVLPSDMAPLAEFLFQIMHVPAAAAVIVATSDAYLGREVTVGGPVRQAGSRLISLWVAAFLQGLLIGVGLILLIVPGVIFYAWSFAMQAAVVLERKGPVECYTRSKELARGNVGHILVSLGITTIVVVALTMAIGIAIGLLTGAFSGGESQLAEAAGNLVTILIYPIVPVVATLLYYDLRIRKEGFDLEMLASTLDPAAAPAGQSSARRANWS